MPVLCAEFDDPVDCAEQLVDEALRPLGALLGVQAAPWRPEADTSKHCATCARIVTAETG